MLNSLERRFLLVGGTPPFSGETDTAILKEIKKGLVGPAAQPAVYAEAKKVYMEFKNLR